MSAGSLRRSRLHRRRTTSRATSRRLLPSLFAQTFRDFAIVAVDNASEDGTRATFAAFEKVTPVPLAVVPSRENLGYTGGHNLAIARAVEAGARGSSSSTPTSSSRPTTSSASSPRPTARKTRASARFTGKILRADGADLVPTDVLDTVGIRMTRTAGTSTSGPASPTTGVTTGRRRSSASRAASRSTGRRRLPT